MNSEKFFLLRSLFVADSTACTLFTLLILFDWFFSYVFYAAMLCIFTFVLTNTPILPLHICHHQNKLFLTVMFMWMSADVRIKIMSLYKNDLLSLYLLIY